MKIDDLLLQNLADWRPSTAEQPLSLQHDESGWQVRLIAEAVDTIGARVWEVVLNRHKLPAETRPLADQAHHIASKVTGLMEPLRLIEVDSARNFAQLRSDTPSQRGDTRAYYEVLRHTDGHTTLRRFETTQGGKRRQVAFALTHEILVKLVADLTAA